MEKILLLEDDSALGRGISLALEGPHPEPGTPPAVGGGTAAGGVISSYPKQKCRLDQQSCPDGILCYGFIRQEPAALKG